MSSTVSAPTWVHVYRKTSWAHSNLPSPTIASHQRFTMLITTWKDLHHLRSDLTSGLPSTREWALWVQGPCLLCSPLYSWCLERACPQKMLGRNFIDTWMNTWTNSAQRSGQHSILKCWAINPTEPKLSDKWSPQRSSSDTISLFLVQSSRRYILSSLGCGGRQKQKKRSFSHWGWGNVLLENVLWLVSNFSVSDWDVPETRAGKVTTWAAACAAILSPCPSLCAYVHAFPDISPLTLKIPAVSGKFTLLPGSARQAPSLAWPGPPSLMPPKHSRVGPVTAADVM